MVVGNPGRVVLQDGRRVEQETPLNHGRDLDPEGEMIKCMLHKIEELEKRVHSLEKGGSDGACSSITPSPGARRTSSL